MKKLGKKIKLQTETVESYWTCNCHARCNCGCDTLVQMTSNALNLGLTRAVQNGRTTHSKGPF